MSVLVIVAGEGYLSVLSLVIPLGSPLNYTNPGVGMSGTLMVDPLVFWFGYDVVWGAGIS